jgi:hypothetical protein
LGGGGLLKKKKKKNIKIIYKLKTKQHANNSAVSTQGSSGFGGEE